MVHQLAARLPAKRALRAGRRKSIEVSTDVRIGESSMPAPSAISFRRQARV
jgi:hypothetical protein